MDVQDAQREMRFVYIGGFWGQLVSSVIWLLSATLGTWPSVREHSESVHSLGMQVAFVLPLSMLLLVPVDLYRLNWFFRP